MKNLVKHKKLLQQIHKNLKAPIERQLTTHFHTTNSYVSAEP